MLQSDPCGYAPAARMFVCMAARRDSAYIRSIGRLRIPCVLESSCVARCMRERARVFTTCVLARMACASWRESQVCELRVRACVAPMSVRVLA